MTTQDGLRREERRDKIITLTLAGLMLALFSVEAQANQNDFACGKRFATMWVDSTYNRHKGGYDPVNATYTIEKKRIIRLARFTNPDELHVYTGEINNPDWSKVPTAIHDQLVECLD